MSGVIVNGRSELLFFINVSITWIEDIFNDQLKSVWQRMIFYKSDLLAIVLIKFCLLIREDFSLQSVTSGLLFLQFAELFAIRCKVHKQLLVSFVIFKLTTTSQECYDCNV